MKARIIITEDCPRNCSYCCNKTSTAMKDAIIINKPWDLPFNCDEYLITGGEPSLVPNKIDDLTEVIKQAVRLWGRYSQKFYLYTARWDKCLEDLLYVPDGVHYTLHEGTNGEDLVRFQQFQTWLMNHPEVSARLYIAPTVDMPITIFPNLYKRVEVKPWQIDCPLPENERLYIWKQ